LKGRNSSRERVPSKGRKFSSLSAVIGSEDKQERGARNRINKYGQTLLTLPISLKAQDKFRKEVTAEAKKSNGHDTRNSHSLRCWQRPSSSIHLSMSLYTGNHLIPFMTTTVTVSAMTMCTYPPSGLLYNYKKM